MSLLHQIRPSVCNFHEHSEIWFKKDVGDKIRKATLQHSTTGLACVLEWDSAMGHFVLFSKAFHFATFPGHLETPSWQE
jgi:hypothetical protein